MTTRTFGLFLLLSIATAAVFPAALPPATAQDADPEAPAVEVIAHQGGDGLRPGNTMAAFEHAVELGVDVLEMDIHGTADGDIVVIHDDTIDRTTDGSGALLALTLPEIQSFDAGYDWTARDPDADEFPFRGAGTTIPRLETVLEAFPDMPMTIEIKQREPSIVDDVCALLDEYEMQERVIIASFHEETMTEFREHCPGYMTSAVESEVTRFVLAALSGNYDLFEPHPSLVAFQVPRRSGEVEVITPEFIEAANFFGIAVQVWTVNDRESMEELVAMGVDGIITDYPDILLDVLGRADNANAAADAGEDAATR